MRDTNSEQLSYELLGAMEAILDPFYMVDENWRFTYINRAAEVFFRLDRALSLGCTYMEVFPGVEDSNVFTVIHAVMHDKQAITQELCSFARPDCWVVFSGVPLPGGGVAVTVKDISDRKRYEEQLAAEIEERKLAEQNALDITSRLDGVLQSTTDCVLMLDPDYRIKFANAKALAFMNTTDQIFGKRISEVFPSAVASMKKYLDQAVTNNQTVSFVQHLAVSARWVSATLYPSDKGLTVFFRDVTEAKQHEEALAESERQFRELADAMPQLVWSADRGGNRYWFNKRWHAYTGVPLHKAKGWGWVNCHHPDDQQSVKELVREGLRTKEPWEGTWRVRGKDGEYRWFLVRAVPVKDNKGQVVKWFGTKTDITASIKDKEHQELLLHELNHRVKNTLAIIQSIGRQTTGDDVKDFRRLFENRLLALSKTHDLLTESDWNSGPLRQLIESEMAPYTMQMEPKPYTLLGPNIKLKPQVVVPLGMAIHELATNAAKYGALSVPGGHVVINWNVDNDGPRTLIRLLWSEGGGPTVEQPTRKGFGTRLLRHSFQGDFGGNVILHYLPMGFQCVMEIPAEHIVDESTERALFRIKKAN